MDEQQFAALTRQYFDDLAPKWDDICRHDKDKLSLIIGLTAPPPDSRALDVGCGAGVMIGPLLTTKPRELLALDISPCMIEQAKRKFSDPCLRLLCEDFFAMEESGFDFAMFYSVYPHFPAKERLARHTARCLNKGGRFVVAHSENRAKINNRHQSGLAAQLSLPLQAAGEEAKKWLAYFNIDILIDTEQLYMISGLRK